MAAASSAERSRSFPKAPGKLTGKKVVPWNELQKGQEYDFYTPVPKGIAEYTGMSDVGPVFTILQHESSPALEGKKGVIMKNQIFFKHHPKLRESNVASGGARRTRRRQHRGHTRQRLLSGSGRQARQRLLAGSSRQARGQTRRV